MDKYPRRTLMALLASSMAVGLGARAVYAEDKPLTLTAAAQQAVTSMGKSLLTEGISFEERTVREYTDKDGQPLHIFHDANVLIRRPDRLFVQMNGDDGRTKIAYDGKSLILYDVESNKYVSVPAPDTVQSTLRMAGEKLGVDFPLADLLADAPAEAFLSGISSGYIVNTVTIEGMPCDHLFFTQPPGIELELWVDQERSLPRRLVVTYRSLPGEPRFIAQMSNWKTDLHPADAEFAFQPPEGATKVEFQPEPGK